MLKLKAKDLRITRSTTQQKKDLSKNPIYIILDNVLDTYNIGAIFRLADAASVTKVFLCKGSETPPNSRIKKASINTTEWVEWEYVERTEDAIENLRKKVKNIQIIAVEQSSLSVPYDTFAFRFPVALVVGHESDGIAQSVLSLCDAIVELPMFGVNVSLNVMVSLGIVLYKVLEHLPQ